MTQAIPHAQIYAGRRAHLAAQLGDGGVAIIPTAPEPVSYTHLTLPTNREV